MSAQLFEVLSDICLTHEELAGIPELHEKLIQDFYDGTAVKVAIIRQ